MEAVLFRVRFIQFVSMLLHVTKRDVLCHVTWQTTVENGIGRS